MKKSELQQFGEHFRDFIGEAARCGSVYTVKNHKVAMQLYLKYLEQVCKVKPMGFSVSHFDEPLISKFLDWLCDVKNCKAQTCNVRLASIRAFLKYAARKDASLLWLYAKASAIKLRRDMNPKMVNPLSQDAINALIKAAGTETASGLKYSTLMVFLYTTATRLDEVLSIKIGELHMNQNPAFVTVIGKGRVSRTLFLPEKLLKYLRKYIAIQHGGNPDHEALLFYSKHKGNRVKQSEEGVNKQLKKYAKIAHATCEDVPQDLHSHQFRHSAATHALENNMSVFQISKMLGHKSVTTTMTYLGITPKIREDAVKKIESGLQVSESPIWRGKTSALQAAFDL